MTPVEADTPRLLDVVGLTASYGHIAALNPTNIHVNEGELVTVLGPNGAGKTTLLRALTRLINCQGQVTFRGRNIASLQTHQIAESGVIMVQEGRGLFAEMSVRENLLLGAYSRRRTETQLQESLDKVCELFPRLRERFDQTAGLMSGGEQQMLAVGRALMASPKLLMLDEPSLGLAPRVAVEIIETLGELNRGGLGILLIEQKAPLALKLARRVYIMSSGNVRAELAAEEIGSHRDLARYYFN